MLFWYLTPSLFPSLFSSTLDSFLLPLDFSSSFSLIPFTSSHFTSHLNSLPIFSHHFNLYFKPIMRLTSTQFMATPTSNNQTKSQQPMTIAIQLTQQLNQFNLLQALITASPLGTSPPPCHNNHPLSHSSRLCTTPSEPFHDRTSLPPCYHDAKCHGNHDRTSLTPSHHDAKCHGNRRKMLWFRMMYHVD